MTRFVDPMVAAVAVGLLLLYKVAAEVARSTSPCRLLLLLVVLLLVVLVVLLLLLGVEVVIFVPLAVAVAVC